MLSAFKSQIFYVGSFTFMLCNSNFASATSALKNSSLKINFQAQKDHEKKRARRALPSKNFLTEKDKAILYVQSPVARIYAKPDVNSKVLTKLRINSAVRGLPYKTNKHVVLILNRKWLLVETIAPEGYFKGFIRAHDLNKDPSEANILLQRAAEFLQKNNRFSPQTAKMFLQRACAADPSSLKAIEAYADFLEHHGQKRAQSTAKKTLYYVRKGWLAARRRELHWDGPLYPIVKGTAYFPAPCDGRSLANQGRKKIPRLELRARAFPFFSSGKSVAISEKGYKTQKLKSPRCAKEQLAYQMTNAKTGTLLASWRVAGFKVLPFTSLQNKNVFLAGRLQISVQKSNFTLEEKTLEGTMRSEKLSYPPSIRIQEKSEIPKPIAWFSEAEQQEFLVLFSQTPHKKCRTGHATRQWLVRFKTQKNTQGSKQLIKLKEGRIYSASTAEECAETLFKPLPFEPRSIERKILLSPQWKQESESPE